MAQITLRDYLQETEDAISSQRIDEALANCQYILAYFPDSLEAQRLLGEVYLAQGQLDDARQSFDWVLANDPENVIAYCNRALVSVRNGDVDTALDCYQQAYELSRGNSQIRQVFNQLSEKAGQQGFMFSKAGLARLYMRGNLLMQSIQEWDSVLATTPDRPDARTGLLEAYWRDGAYEQVTQLATQILQDIPGCVKALLLLAHVTSVHNSAQAQEYIRRAEALDPDLLMAQDLFADLSAKSPQDPFLALLQKKPAAFNANAVEMAPEISSPRINAVEPSGSGAPAAPAARETSLWGGGGWGTNMPTPSANPPSMPGSDAYGGTENNAQPESFSQHKNSSENVWSGNNSANSLWDTFGLDSATSTTQSGASEPEPWQLLQEALNEIKPETALSYSQSGLEMPDDPWASAQHSLHGAEHVDEPVSTPLQHSQHGVDQVEPQPQSQPAFSHDLYNVSQLSGSDESSLFSDLNVQSNDERGVEPVAQVEPELAPSAGALPDFATENKTTASPSWLNMLTQPEQSQPEQQPSSFEQSQMLQEAKNEADVSDSLHGFSMVPEAPSQEPSQKQTSFSATLRWDEEPAPAVPPAVEKEALPTVEDNVSPLSEPVAQEDTLPYASDDDDADEESFFGPNWLKSIGATSLGESTELPAVSAEVLAATPADSAPAMLSTSPVEPFEEKVPDSIEIAQAQMQETEPVMPEPDVHAVYQPEEEPVRQYNNDPADRVDHSSEKEAFASWASAFSTVPQASNEPEWWQSLQQASQEPSSVFAELQGQGKDVSQLDWQQPEYTPVQDMSDALQPSRSNTSQLSQDSVLESPDWLAQMGQSQWQMPDASIPEPEPVPQQQPQPQEDAARDAAADEQNLITTLEELEQRLLSHGFVPMEPNSLEAIAQNQEQEEVQPSVVPEPVAENNPALLYQPEPSLSDAFAKLSNNASFPAEQPIIEQSAQQPEEEPLWLQALRTVPAPTTIEQQPSYMNHLPVPEFKAEFRQPEAESVNDQPVVDQPVKAVEMPVSLENTNNPALDNPFADPEATVRVSFENGQIVSSRPQEQSGLPRRGVRSEASPNPLFENELETTMKRPAVRLQPMQQRMASLREQNLEAANAKAQRTEDAGGQKVSNDNGSGNSSHRDRLLKGYQAQLVGEYDSAMHEYRIIIRSAPDLLSEVVSNVRALLKIAPKYSAGYRVLGDAYMRQGEYLQAMEAYNKALTMAKKAKG
ncbi:MAG TPA: tetratricopeptide repeat protein [Dictyobacter sp.]|jgi:tetratricopeptide (TPR) repeat protein|nr:tetratricopeptide repeat protein [Dictyobacter sp.]